MRYRLDEDDVTRAAFPSEFFYIHLLFVILFLPSFFFTFWLNFTKIDERRTFARFAVVCFACFLCFDFFVE